MESPKSVEVCALRLLEGMDGLLAEKHPPHRSDRTSGGRDPRFGKRRHDTTRQSLSRTGQVVEGVLLFEVTELRVSRRRREWIPGKRAGLVHGPRRGDLLHEVPAATEGPDG